MLFFLILSYSPACFAIFSESMGMFTLFNQAVSTTVRGEMSKEAREAVEEAKNAMKRAELRRKREILQRHGDYGGPTIGWADDADLADYEGFDATARVAKAKRDADLGRRRAALQKHVWR